jgi:H+-translocating NAD(P) transhydrogenase subunit alpha
MKEFDSILKKIQDLSLKLSEVSQDVATSAEHCANLANGGQNFLSLFTIFILSCFVGYYLVWKVTPALHAPLMSVTNAISGIIILGAIIVLGVPGLSTPHYLGFVSVVIASINIFGGFVITYRMLSMFRSSK